MFPCGTHERSVYLAKLEMTFIHTVKEEKKEETVLNVLAGIVLVFLPYIFMLCLVTG